MISWTPVLPHTHEYFTEEGGITVISLTLAAILHLPLLAAPVDGSAVETYAEAHRQTVETGRPMVVMVGAEWCPACKQMENAVLPKVRERGLLRRVAFALVDLDRERELGQKLIAGGPIPQLIAFRKTANGWEHDRLVGGQSLEQIEEFINQEVNLTAQAEKGGNEASPADRVKKAEAAKGPSAGKVSDATPAKAQIRTVSTN